MIIRTYGYGSGKIAGHSNTFGEDISRRKHMPCKQTVDDVYHSRYSHSLSNDLILYHDENNHMSRMFKCPMISTSKLSNERTSSTSVSSSQSDLSGCRQEDNHENHFRDGRRSVKDFNRIKKLKNFRSQSVTAENVLIGEFAIRKGIVKKNVERFNHFYYPIYANAICAVCNETSNHDINEKIKQQTFYLSSHKNSSHRRDHHHSGETTKTADEQVTSRMGFVNNECKRNLEHLLANYQEPINDPFYFCKLSRKSISHNSLHQITNNDLCDNNLQQWQEIILKPEKMKFFEKIIFNRMNMKIILT
ncbi:hypothetical protein HELRODRAFT_167822 [Helobdella robusta]|uniref:Uncharacterized protein n=1 Tax=Helobdella robusta TaxID=6412 RepID=T1EZU3_HELRO|nr:hypothetical protein HELRODRAFT_167822 [Helobdella robusta]ESO09988.1 hypothetical protein HELRODRAFT_167822 [Helobdella robusta]